MYAVETQGPLNESVRDLLSDVGRRMSSGDDREVSFFSVFQLSCNDLIALCCMTVFTRSTLC